MTLTVTTTEPETQQVAEVQPFDGVGGWQLIGETETLENWTDIIPGLRAKAESIVAANKDESPEFPVVRVEEGWSNSGRLWDANCLVKISEQVNELEPVGHLGHIKEEDFATAFPEPQTVWLGAICRDEPSQSKAHKGKMVKVMYAKGYNLPGAKVRTYLKSKAVRGVSWLGFAETTRVPGKGVAVNGDSFKLKAFDWARKLAEGMPTSSVIAIASEMEGITVGDKPLSAVTPAEFKQENPNGFALLVQEAVADKDKLIGEQEDKIKEGEKVKDVMTKVREALGIPEDADPLEAIALLTKKLGVEASRAVQAAVDKVLEKKVPDEENRKLIRRLLPVAEMEAKAKDAKDEEEVVKLVGEMTDAAFDSDDIIKSYVSEQAPPIVRRREELGTKTGDGEDNLKGNRYAQREVRTVS